MAQTGPPRLIRADDASHGPECRHTDDDDDHDDDDGPGDFQNYLSVEPTLSRKERKTTLIWIVKGMWWFCWQHPSIRDNSELAAVGHGRQLKFEPYSLQLDRYANPSKNQGLF